MCISLAEVRPRSPYRALFVHYFFLNGAPGGCNHKRMQLNANDLAQQCINKGLECARALRNQVNFFE